MSTDDQLPTMPAGDDANLVEPDPRAAGVAAPDAGRAAGGAEGPSADVARRPYGSWSTPITSELVVRASVGLGGAAIDGDAVWWSELRPEEGGRTQLVRRTEDTGPVDVLPNGANARTAVHEYGGGAWGVAAGLVWYSEWSDQRLRVLEPGSAERGW